MQNPSEEQIESVQGKKTGKRRRTAPRAGGLHPPATSDRLPGHVHGSSRDQIQRAYAFLSDSRERQHVLHMLGKDVPQKGLAPHLRISAWCSEQPARDRLPSHSAAWPTDRQPPSAATGTTVS